LLDSTESLPDEAFFTPNVVGVWTLRDVLAHITTWEEETLKTLPWILKGQPVPRYAKYGGIDAFNAREQEKKKDLTLHQVKDELQATHQRLVTFLQTVPESNFSSGERFLHRLRLDTYNHYHEHARQILVWESRRRMKDEK
jgi:hypothetical protein